MNLLSFATKLVTVAQKAVEAVKDAQLVFTYAAHVMNAAETAWAAAGAVAGATKKAQVMAAAQAFCDDAKIEFPLIEAALSAWVDVTIAAYNAAAELIPNAPQVDSTAVDAAVATGEQAANTLLAGASSVVASVASTSSPAVSTVAAGTNTQGL